MSQTFFDAQGGFSPSLLCRNFIFDAVGGCLSTSSCRTLIFDVARRGDTPNVNYDDNNSDSGSLQLPTQTKTTLTAAAAASNANGDDNAAHGMNMQHRNEGTTRNDEGYRKRAIVDTAQ
jgi:hypothetical protein